MSSKPQLSRKRLLADAKLVVDGMSGKIARNEVTGFPLTDADREWYKGYVTAWADIQMDIKAGIYDKGGR